MPPCAVTLLVAGLVAGCAPVLDWREVRAEGSGLHAMLPCRPSREQRAVVLAGRPRDLQMLSCAAGEATWALACIDGVEPTQVADLLIELRRQSVRNVGAGEGPLLAQGVPGSTPNPQAGRLRVSGRRPDGSGLTLETAVFTRGTSVCQATVLATRPAPEALEQFFGALRFGG